VSQRRLGKEPLDNSFYFGGKGAAVEMSSVRTVDYRGVFLDGESDYTRLTNWPISGPFFIGGLF
jgi:hypothetical protein